VQNTEILREVNSTGLHFLHLCKEAFAPFSFEILLCFSSLAIRKDKRKRQKVKETHEYEDPTEA
jgi:hypothetical protein